MLLTTEQASAFRDIMAICAATDGQPHARLLFEGFGGNRAVNHDRASGMVVITRYYRQALMLPDEERYDSPAAFATAYNPD